jgi:hypothetical protein
MSLALNQSAFIPNSRSPLVVHLLKTSATTLSSAVDSIPLENRLPIKATFISLYVLIFFFGITGNALVVRK